MTFDTPTVAILIAAGNLIGALIWLLSSMNTHIKSILENHLPHLSGQIETLQEQMKEIKNHLDSRGQ